MPAGMPSQADFERARLQVKGTGLSPYIKSPIKTRALRAAKELGMEGGWGFNPSISRAKLMRALAPEVFFASTESLS